MTNKFAYGKRFICHIISKMAGVFFSQDSNNSRRREMRRLDERLDNAMQEVKQYKQNWRYCLRLVFKYLRCIIGVRYMYVSEFIHHKRKIEFLVAVSRLVEDNPDQLQFPRLHYPKRNTGISVPRAEPRGVYFFFSVECKHTPRDGKTVASFDPSAFDPSAL